jgi:hypothetical protein
MKNRNAPENQIARSILPSACAAALAVALTVSLPQAVHAYARRVTPPPVPTDIAVPADQRAFLEGHRVGTQNYICLPSATGFAWTLFTPEATLFDDYGKQLTTHFFSPNPFEDNTLVRATWEDSRDTSTVWGQVIQPSSDPNFVAPGAIPWLKIKVVGVQDGPFWGDTLSDSTFIQRLNTRGGSAPATGCAEAKDIGQKAFVPYTADYFFFAGPSDR